MIVTLIGYRGCGKSSVGPLLAERIGCSCVDTDDLVEDRAGKSIAVIFAEDGEPVFRQLESAVLEELLGKPPLVIAAGGGAILAEVNRTRMKVAGPVVWLKARAATLASRIGQDSSSGDRRPSLTGRSIDVEVAEVLRVRMPLYKEAATITVDAESETPQQIADRIFVAITGDEGGNT